MGRTIPQPWPPTQPDYVMQGESASVPQSSYVRWDSNGWIAKLMGSISLVSLAVQFLWLVGEKRGRNNEGATEAPGNTPRAQVVQLPMQLACLGSVLRGRWVGSWAKGPWVRGWGWVMYPEQLRKIFSICNPENIFCMICHLYGYSVLSKLFVKQVEGKEKKSSLFLMVTF